jgi:prophage regulatory protein
MDAHSSTFPVILRRKQIEASFGYSRSTIYARIADGLWPRPVQMGARAVGWLASEAERLIAARIAGKSDDDIRALVCRMHHERTAAPSGTSANPSPMSPSDPGSRCRSVGVSS